MIEVKFLQVGTGVNKTSALIELMMSMNPNNIAFLNIRNFDYRCIINEINNSETMGLLKSANLNQEPGSF